VAEEDRDKISAMVQQVGGAQTIEEVKSAYDGAVKLRDGFLRRKETTRAKSTNHRCPTGSRGRCLSGLRMWIPMKL
jgi:hypothetical protein